MSNNAINRDDFTAQFEQFFVDPDNHYGGVDESKLTEILESLGLPTELQMSDDYSVIHDYFNAGHNYTLVRSQIDLQPEHTNEGKHCSVLTGIDPEFFSLWTPCQNGNDIPLHLPRANWAAKECFGITLFYSRPHTAAEIMDSSSTKAVSFSSARTTNLSIGAMCVCNPDRSPAEINRCDAAPTPTGFAEIVSDDFPVFHVLVSLKSSPELSVCCISMMPSDG